MIQYQNLPTVKFLTHRLLINAVLQNSWHEGLFMGDEYWGLGLVEIIVTGPMFDLLHLKGTCSFHQNNILVFFDRAIVGGHSLFRQW